MVSPEEPVGGEYPATVTVVDRVVDAASGTFGVRLELPNPDRALSAGLKCRVRF
jgi:multidrug efflux pump subunit AcrA (membrane-fusion protein)